MSSLRGANTFIILLLALIVFISPSIATHPKVIIVREGQKIQEAIDRAWPYTKIIIEAGEYKEQLVIQKDGIELYGKPSAKLIPPNVYKDNICTGIAGNVSREFTGGEGQSLVPTQNGICVIGDVDLLPIPVGGDHKKISKHRQFIKHVKISGLEVFNFTGINIVVVAGRDTDVEKNRLIQGQRYGLLTVGSVNTKFERNDISNLYPSAYAYIGICNDDMSGVKIWNNKVEGYFIGLCIQTSGADVRGNHVSETCFGAFVDPGVDGALVRWNHIRKTSQACFMVDAVGINVVGAHNTEVRWNHIREITSYGTPGKPGVGISVNEFFGDDVASGNKVRDNYLKLNDLDIWLASNGTGNVAKNNHCTKSVPAELCKSG